MADTITEPETTEPEEPETPETTPAEMGTEVDSDKAVEKLQKRLGKETAEKKDLQTQLDEAVAKLKQVQEGKGPKKLSDDEKEVEANKAKDQQIIDLQNKLKLTQSKVETNDVLKEAGLTVSSDVLDLVVSVDDKKTLANAKALIEYSNSVKDGARKEFMKGIPPRDGGDTKKKPTSLNDMSMTEQSQLMRDDPDLYQKLSRK